MRAPDCDDEPAARENRNRDTGVASSAMASAPDGAVAIEIEALLVFPAVLAVERRGAARALCVASGSRATSTSAQPAPRALPDSK